jgi:phosphatidylglycerol lysyltransferase
VKALWPAFKRYGPTVFGLLLLLGALYVVQREFRGLSWSDVREALDETPALALWIAAGWTLLAYAVLTVYDRLGSVYAGHPVSYARTSLASFCAYTLAHNIGVATVSGAAVRYRFYAAWGLSPTQIAKLVAFTSLTFALGGLAIGGFVLVVEPEMVPWFADHTPRWVMQAVGLALWAVLLGYILLSKLLPSFTAFGHRIDLPGFRMALAQTLLASVDVAVTAMIFFALLPHSDQLSFVKFLGVYVAAYTAGLAAHVPGGIGVFDTVMLLALQPYYSNAEIVGAILLFRLYYYIVPLFLAVGLFVAFEIGQRRHLLQRLSREQSAADALEIPALTALVGLGALVLIFIGALPPKPDRMVGWLDLFDGAASHFAASVVGSLLLVAAYGLTRRLRIAWWGALLLLLNAAALLWLRGESAWLTGAFVAVALALGVFREGFYRRARLLAEPLAAETAWPVLAGLACGLTLATVAYAGKVRDEAWWGVVLSEAAPASLRFTVAVAAVLLLVAALRLLRPAKLRAEPYDDSARARLLGLGARLPPAADGALFAESGRAGLAFRRLDGVWLALGDPAGFSRADRIAAIWRFRDLCERNRVDPAFASVGEDLLPVYADLGLTALPAREAGRFVALRAERDLERLKPLLAE